jgi:hypothetical protein
VRTRQYVHGRWTNADLLFLVSAVGQGMSLAEAAGFLGRTEEEVRKKAAPLSTPVRHRQDVRRRTGHQNRCRPLAQTLITSKAG